MNMMTKYVVFETAWGFAGFSAGEGGVTAVCMPVASDRAARARFRGATFDANLMKDLQRAMCRYFDGNEVDFRAWPKVDLSHLGEFGAAVLKECRRLGFGGKATYGQLAAKVGRPGAARAAGTVLANNPIPLIVPCHRILRSDGGLGGYSAEGGTKMKNRLLRLESHR
jgi:methylated-DNA-[protein]-cysteine S-methyltransferase